MLKGTLLWNFWIVLKAPIIGFVLSVGLLTILYFLYAQFFVDRDNSKAQSSLSNLRSVISTIVLAGGLGVALPAFFIVINYKGVWFPSFAQAFEFLGDTRNFLYVAILNNLGIAIALLVSWRSLRQLVYWEPVSAIGLKGFSLVFVGVVFAVLVGQWWNHVIGVSDFPAPIGAVRGNLEPWFQLLLVLYVIVLSPLVEEILFRGLVFGSLNRVLSVGYALIVQGAIFSLAHGSFVEFIPLFIKGLILGYIYKRTSTLWAPVIAHSLMNIVVLF